MATSAQEGIKIASCDTVPAGMLSAESYHEHHGAITKKVLQVIHYFSQRQISVSYTNRFYCYSR